MEIGRRRRDVSMIETSNLRDLLKRKDSDEGLESLAGLTLAAVLGCEEARRAPTRTLMDIINDEESGAAYRGLALPNQQRHNNKQQSWKSFKDRLRIRKAGVAWSASSAYPVSPTEFNLEDVRLEISPPISSSGPSNRNTVPISAINGGGDSVQPNNPAGGRGSSGGIVADSVATSAPAPAPAPNPASPTAASGAGDSVLASNPARISEEITQIMAESSNNMPASTVNVGDLVPATAPIQQVRNQENSSIEIANSASEAASPASQVIRLAAALEAEREEQRISRQRQEAEERGTEPAMPPPPPPMRMSLMDLLGETDRETGTRYMRGEGEEEEEEEEEGCEEGKLGCNKELGEEEEEEEGKEEGKVEFVCCVCMVRHKDAAFIPCGHTFCRVCSKELWVSRGNCPLCNNFILEILHIF